MALIETDKNGLGAGSAEVLLGSSLLEQHPTAPLQDLILPSPGSHRQPLQGVARFRIHGANSKT